MKILHYTVVFLITQEEVLPMVGVDNDVVGSAGRIGEPLVVGGILTALNLGLSFLNGNFNSSLSTHLNTYIFPMTIGGSSVFVGDYIENTINPVL